MAKSFTVACREYFGYQAGAGLAEFAKELKALTYEDKLEIAKGLRSAGVECIDPEAPKEAVAA